jgi:hypothetical protein
MIKRGIVIPEYEEILSEPAKAEGGDLQGTSEPAAK